MNKPESDIFEHCFTKDEKSKIYPNNFPNEQILIDIAENWEDNTKPGYGMFFEFKDCPELQKPVLDYLIKGFGWTLEKENFIRKPE